MKNKVVKNSVLHFSRWGNKSFSAFNSLHRMVKVCVLSSVYFVSLGQAALVAQTEEGNSKEITLEEVEVNAETNELAMESDLMRIIAVVNESEIARSSAQSVTQLLESLPGIDIKQRGAYSTQADLSIRAGSFDQVLIMLNGINISDPQTGHNNLNLPISLSSIARIEVLEGAGLRYNTAGAFTGAINIITKTANKTTAEANISYGDHRYSNVGADIYLKQKNFRHQLSMSRTASDGYRYNTDFETQRLYLNSTFKKEQIKIDYQMGYINNGFGSNGFYSALYPDQYEEINALTTSLKAEIGKQIKLSPKIYYKRSFDRFELFHNFKDAASWYTAHNYHQTDVLGGGLDAKTTYKLGTTRLGLDFRNERIRSNKLGEDITPIAHPHEDSIYYTKEKSRINYNAFLNHTFYYKNWATGLNVLINYNEITEKVKPYLGLDVSYQISPQLSVKASGNQSFRLPTFTELYYTGPTNIGNSDLTQEEALTMDCGINYKRPFFQAQGSFYYRKGTDIIDWVKQDISSSNKWQTMNYTEVNTYGFELQASVYPSKLSSKLAFIEKIKGSYTYNESQLEKQEFISYYALDYLKNKVTLTTDFLVLEKVKISLLTQYQERHNPTDATSKYQPFWLWDAHLQWDGKHISPFVKINNILNTTYYDFNDLPQAGRWAIIGVKVKL